MLPPPLPHQLDVLGRVHDRATVAAADGGPPPLVIFGLDGVLFDTRPRTLRILREYADDVAFDYPEVAEGLRALELFHVHPLLSDTLRQGGVTKADFVRDVTSFWHERYYAGDYLVHDEPNAGAADYVRALRPLLDRYGNDPGLTIILFTLDETVYSRELAPLAGHYPVLKLGPAWWFHDSPEGMRRFREQTTETAGFYNTVGFNDDTRAFLSIPARHDVARRMDCGFLARLVAEHRMREDDAHRIAVDLTYNLAKAAYRL